MRRSLARCAIDFTSASVGLRRVSRSVSRTYLLALCNDGGGISCSISGSVKIILTGRVVRSRNEIRLAGIRANKKGGRFPASPLEPLQAPPVHQDPAE